MVSSIGQVMVVNQSTLPQNLHYTRCTTHKSFSQSVSP